jgi:hypothetical protein
LRGISGETDLTLSIDINNGTQVFTRLLHAPRTYDFTIQEVLPANLLLLGENANTITFTRTNVVGGPLTVSDIIVWFRVDSEIMRTVQMDGNGNIFAGGAGANGDLVLRSEDDQTRIHLDGGNADVSAGGNGASGNLRLFASDAASTVAANATVDLDGSGGEGRFGGNGRTGKVRLYLSETTGSSGFTDTAATIVLAGDNGNIQADGSVRAKAFYASGTLLNVPDYVWDSNYALMSLAELRAYTAREKRLPNMPSAAEIKREGLNLSQFQMQLLEKVEELTRYLLTQQETIQAQQAQIDALGSQSKQPTQGKR